MQDRRDVVVVGARCAGASTAMLLARAGLRVLAVDRAPEGSDTLSTHALMRGAVLQLHRWGLLDRVRASGAPPIRRTTFDYPGETVSVDILPRDGVDALYAPRRTVLDKLLCDAAREAGAEVRHRASVRRVVLDADGRARGVILEDGNGTRVVRADLVIGADGWRSGVAAGVGAETYWLGSNAGDCVYGYFRGLPNEGFRWYYRPDAAVGAIPTNDGLTCVFAVAPVLRPEVFATVVGGVAPDLVVTARSTVGLRMHRGQPGFLRRATGPGWALVGDAGAYRDPISAHGITDALRDAELLARAVLRGDLAGFQAERDEAAAPLMHLADAIAAFDGDLDVVRALHRAQSEEMKRECALLAGFDRLAA